MRQLESNKNLPNDGMRTKQVNIFHVQLENGCTIFRNFNVTKVTNVTDFIGGTAVGMVEWIIRSTQRVTAYILLLHKILEYYVQSKIDRERVRKANYHWSNHHIGEHVNHAFQEGHQ